MLEKIIEIIAGQLTVESSTISESSSFKEDLGADSLELFELIMAVEEEYDIEIPSEDLNTMETVGDLITYLKNKGVE
ncbi:acyl carrier protein [Anaerocolumna chitinilytica]|jgi:acyl carrier protein|uniref:Acyl carrier protein n=1 Tax=Anaerocolumna chitinilytica TaxID=1727145 RepID=A0A7I8DH08_9FIRM|nr:acyl carrier protein [Anaerocolumna chitinilytica]BCJ97783.1 acyl carrier protein [Anaerocolumna chitinilytica]